MRFVFLAATLLAVGRSFALGILVPAYFDPTATTQWTWLNQAAERVPLVAIMNPNSGPGSKPLGSYLQAIANLRRSGGQVIGYVHASYARRPMVDVRAEVDRYISFYAPDGFFIDEMTNDNLSTNVAYFEDLYRYIKSKGTNYFVVGNPGINAPVTYLARPCADAIVTFEHHTGYLDYKPDFWTQSWAASSISHLCYAVAPAEAMSNYVTLAVQRNAGLIYITDDSGANPWDRLPSYWEEEVALVESINRQAAANRPARLNISQTNRSAVINVSGASGRFVIAESTNLPTWRAVATNLSAAGSFILTNTVRPSEALRLYRAEQ